MKVETPQEQKGKVQQPKEKEREQEREQEEQEQVEKETGTDDESEDSDYDPNKPNKVDEDSSDDDSEKEEETNGQIHTRSRRYQDSTVKTTTVKGIANPNIDFNELFNSLKHQSITERSLITQEWLGDEKNDDIDTAKNPQKPNLIIEDNDDTDKVWIKTSYTFAGKVITESKQVDANSAEAKAFLNSTGLQMDTKHRSFVPVIRTIPGETEPTELKIKLKRPSLVDKFLNSHGNKRMKLSTLEKSRLDWASFVDTSNINDELKSHNKDGYLERQDFLDRVSAKRDQHYDEAKAKERLQREQQLL